MSLRTMPLMLSAFTPFEPSPGNGPAVSSGIAAEAPAALELPVEAEPEPPHAARTARNLTLR